MKQSYADIRGEGPARRFWAPTLARVYRLRVLPTYDPSMWYHPPSGDLLKLGFALFATRAAAERFRAEVLRP